MNLIRDHQGAIVCDLGSSFVKAGLAGEQFPKAVFPTIIGKPKSHVDTRKLFGAREKMNEAKSYFVGLEAHQRKGICELSHPINRGGKGVQNWDDIELLLEHIYHFHLRVNPKDHPILLTEQPLTSVTHRQQYIQLLFEKFQSHSLFFAIQGLLSIYATGDLDGIVLDSGDGSTHVVPVFEGYPQTYAMLKSELAGCDITNHLTKLMLQHSGYDFTQNSASLDFVRDVKEASCYVALNYDHTLKLFQESKKNEFRNQFQLPDGTFINIDCERFQAAEILFQPNMIGSEELGIHELLNTSIQHCNMDIRKNMFKNVILSGGNTLIKGIQERLTREMTRMVGGAVRLRIIAPPERKYSVWIGGSILSSLSSFQDRWIRRADYEELGPDLISKMLFH
ncbi:hypothetical protein NAEGRDRAFT_44886 [Naegleria gruberi]|uniref:Actin n=1 Tax=Naegleria gruberi TaxID=5762 RepID=D2W474_NAEGR|nr:uncharacterized protein NAEGRDRAFT_44886 [Naegleria gruberi]EFC36130.1 hypothetical protein NAEGRDRAFT_44886 [Naegleria gruberi]|eukprot:XP_002668874.1 hypothetical protein NAEGRDRAFT_44886 [Naegleria gruberi strain NEG-M]